MAILLSTGVYLLPYWVFAIACVITAACVTATACVIAAACVTATACVIAAACVITAAIITLGLQYPKIIMHQYYMYTYILTHKCVYKYVLTGCP